MTEPLAGSGLPPPHSPAVPGDGSESERERLIATWRLHSDALVDLCSPEAEGGAGDCSGVVRMSDVRGNQFDEFRFPSAEAADETVDYALARMRGLGSG